MEQWNNSIGGEDIAGYCLWYDGHGYLFSIGEIGYIRTASRHKS